MIELIIEDGSIVENANSYATVEQIITYAETRGVSLNSSSPLDETAIAAMAINAMDYLESLGPQYVGEPVEPGVQSLSWPRKNAYIYMSYPHAPFPSDKIPRELIAAQCQLCIYISTGIVLMPTGNTSAFVKREKIGPIETEYSEIIAQSLGLLPRLPLVDALLRPLMRSDAFTLRSIRV